MQLPSAGLAYKRGIVPAVSGSAPWPPDRTARARSASGAASVGVVRCNSSARQRVLPLSDETVARSRTLVSGLGREHAAARAHKYGWRDRPILASRAAALLRALATALHRRII